MRRTASSWACSLTSPHIWTNADRHGPASALRQRPRPPARRPGRPAGRPLPAVLVGQRQTRFFSSTRADRDLRRGHAASPLPCSRAAGQDVRLHVGTARPGRCHRRRYRAPRVRAAEAAYQGSDAPPAPPVADAVRADAGGLLANAGFASGCRPQKYISPAPPRPNAYPEFPKLRNCQNARARPLTSDAINARKSSRPDSPTLLASSASTRGRDRTRRPSSSPRGTVIPPLSQATVAITQCQRDPSSKRPSILRRLGGPSPRGMTAARNQRHRGPRDRAGRSASTNTPSRRGVDNGSFQITARTSNHPAPPPRLRRRPGPWHH